MLIKFVKFMLIVTYSAEKKMFDLNILGMKIKDSPKVKIIFNKYF